MTKYFICIVTVSLGVVLAVWFIPLLAAGGALCLLGVARSHGGIGVETKRNSDEK